MSNRSIASALRVAQLDTAELDNSAVTHLTARLQDCFKYKLFNRDLMQFEPLFRTAMFGLLLYWTLWKNGQTIGQKLLRLRFANQTTLAAPPKHKLLFFQAMLTIQFFVKAGNVQSRYFSSKFMNKLINFIDSSVTFLSLVNFLVFLRKGRFQSLLHRIAGLRTVYVDHNPLQRTLSFDLMEREMLWHGFAETAIFFLSFFNISKLRRNFSDFLFPKQSCDDVAVFDSCAFCNHVPILPYEGACKKHVYCYYCVAVSLGRDEGLTCPSCNIPIKYAQPLRCQMIKINQF